MSAQGTPPERQNDQGADDEGEVLNFDADGADNAWLRAPRPGRRGRTQGRLDANAPTRDATT